MDRQWECQAEERASGPSDEPASPLPPHQPAYSMRQIQTYKDEVGSGSALNFFLMLRSARRARLEARPLRGLLSG